MHKFKLLRPANSDTNINSENNRRSFLKKATAAAITFAGAGVLPSAADSPVKPEELENEIPWFRRVTRWGQTNITEKDPIIYDISWWRNHWKRTQTQGVIINAGGIVAYYPTKIPYHYKAQYLQGRDLFGDLCKAAHDDGWCQFHLNSILNHELIVIS